jgi:hypothetical protein
MNSFCGESASIKYLLIVNISAISSEDAGESKFRDMHFSLDAKVVMSFFESPKTLHASKDGEVIFPLWSNMQPFVSLHTPLSEYLQHVLLCLLKLSTFVQANDESTVTIISH